MLTFSQMILNPGAHLKFINNTGGYDRYVCTSTSALCLNCVTVSVCIYVTGFWKPDCIVTREINRIPILMLMQFQQVHTSKIFPILGW